MKSDTKTRNTKKTIVRMLAAMLIGGVIGGVSTVVYEIVFGEDFSGRSLSLLTEVTRRLMVPGLLSVLVVSIAAYEICFKKLRNVCDRIEDAEDEEFHRLDYEEGMAQARYVKLLQKVHPEKKGDIASKDFHKQWLESCDEAEKEAVYQSSYSTYIFSGKLIGILLVVTMIAHLFFNTGVFAIVVVGVIYLCITVKYCVSCVKLKNKS